MTSQGGILCGALVLALFSEARAAPQQQDVIRGRVTGPDGLPVAGVTVSATSYTGGVKKPAKTDQNGRYTIVFANGEGDYWLEFRAIGFVPRRFEIKRVASEEILLGDARLASSIAILEVVNVTVNAPRALPARTDVTADISGTDRTLTIAALSADVAGNLAEAAALHPGIQLIPGFDGAADAFSALGISGDQNTTTYNGLGSALGVLPRDAQTTASVRTFNYDPSIGGFGGAQIAVVSRSGSNFSSTSMSGVARGPVSEVTTELAEEQGAKNTLLSLGGSALGPIRLDRLFYNLSYQGDRNFRDLRTALNISDAALAGAGVAGDSVVRLLNLLEQLGVPAQVAAAPRLQQTDRILLSGNIDFAPQASGIGNAFMLSAATTLARTMNAGNVQSSLLSVPSHSAESRSASTSIALRHSNYFWFGVLSTTTLGVSVATTSTVPYLQMPQGFVRVRSALPDGESAIRTLSFGGFPADQNSRNTAIELLNQSTWYEGNNRHAIKLTSSIRLERYRSDQGNNLLGSFTFGSLADLEAGIPERFERTLASGTRAGRQLVMAASLGDSWRPTRNVQFQYGLRVDGNRVMSAPAFNRDVLNFFGVRNDVVPNRTYVSPRLGAQWLYGQAPQALTLIGTARPPRAVIQGGIGVFQNIASAPSLLNPVLNNTGLADAARMVQCVGPAAPTPAWMSYAADPASIPEQCADGSIGTAFANGAPNVALYDQRYEQARVLRSNISWSGPVWSNRLVIGVALQYQRGFDQQAMVDLNLATVPIFTLENEAGRPVFVSPNAIVESSGAIAPGASRRVPAFNRVNALQSSLQQESRLISASMRPALTNTSFNWALTYTLQHAKEQYVGFASSGSNPFARSWSPALLPRKHTVNATFFYNAFDLVRLNGFVGIASGAAFTPTILGDVNGDGITFNDRAFVFDPAHTEDAVLAAGMRRVLDGGSVAARRCLTGQVSRLSSRGSCNGPWQATANLNLSLNSQKIGLPARMRITLNINNPLVLADIIAHGQSGVRGWGQALAPDQTLLAVRGFDPSAQQFRYEVNERFGSTRPSQTVQRGQTLFGLNVHYDLGAARERQVLTQRLDLGRRRPGTKQIAPAIKAFGASTIPNPIALILQQPDSIRLTRMQADSLVGMNRSYARHADSVWASAATDLAGLPDDYHRSDAYRRYVEARERTIDYLIVVAPRVKALLTLAQQRMLPQTIRDWLDVRVLRALRSSTSG